MKKASLRMDCRYGADIFAGHGRSCAKNYGSFRFFCQGWRRGKAEEVGKSRWLSGERAALPSTHGHISALRVCLCFPLCGKVGSTVQAQRRSHEKKIVPNRLLPVAPWPRRRRKLISASIQEPHIRVHAGQRAEIHPARGPFACPYFISSPMPMPAPVTKKSAYTAFPTYWSTWRSRELPRSAPAITRPKKKCWNAWRPFMTSILAEKDQLRPDAAKIEKLQTELDSPEQAGLGLCRGERVRHHPEKPRRRRA